MQYNPYDSSGTDDDLPQTHQNRVPRGGRFSGNGRASVAPFPYMRAHNEMESEIHRIEQEAYTAVLRAFKLQSDAISWEKESLITELRKELKVSNEEHRELLNKVNEDEVIRRMRSCAQTLMLLNIHVGVTSMVIAARSLSSLWLYFMNFCRELRQGGGAHGILNHGSKAVHDPELGSSIKRQKTSHSIPLSSAGPQPAMLPSHTVATSKQQFSSASKRGASGTKHKNAKTKFVQSMLLAQASADPTSLIGQKVMTRWPDDNNFYEAIITNYNPSKGEHAFVYDMNTQAETWEWVRLSDMAPEDIRWECDDQGIPNRNGWGASGPVLKRHPSNNGAMAGSGNGRGNFPQNELIKDYAPSQNGIAKKDFEHVDVPHTESVVKEVERVLASPDIYKIEKARKLLKDQEQSLLDAITCLDEASDGGSEDMATKGPIGSADDHMGGNGIP